MVPLSPELEALFVAHTLVEGGQGVSPVQTPRRFHEGFVHAKLKDVRASEFIVRGDLKPALQHGYFLPESKQEPEETSSRIDILSLRPVPGPLDGSMRGDLPRLGESGHEHNQKSKP